ncbi:MAG: CinA family nicotinamide mononucleotide deamidase-related protein [Polyangiaceae bacterium]|nr:CinA family nicotinamide mononucleotide deamidase-related protein [Polyangiaceae bacterium]
MSATILTIGTEITRGELQDRNSSWLADYLTDAGHEVLEIVSVPDDDDDIVSTLHRLSQKSDLIICTGGLGPTSDDRTSACVAKALHVPLRRHPEVLEQIQQKYQQRNRPMARGNEKQADFPTGAVILENDRGTAPGFSVNFDSNGKKCRGFFMPGVPREMEGIFEKHVLPSLPVTEEHFAVRRLQCCGIPESEVGKRLEYLEEKYSLIIGYRASASIIEIKVIARGPTDHREDINSRAAAAFEEIHQALSGHVFAEGRVSLPSALGDLLRKKEMTLSLAESCTGGMVASQLTDVSGSSHFFLGGICAYSNEVKGKLLKIPQQILEEEGAVSASCAREMAQNTRNLFQTTWSIAITGIAGPGGGTPEKPVGLVHFAIAGPHGVENFQRIFTGNRDQVRKFASTTALWKLWLTLAA